MVFKPNKNLLIEIISVIINYLSLSIDGSIPLPCMWSKSGDMKIFSHKSICLPVCL